MWAVELGLIWEKLEQLVLCRPKDQVDQLRIFVLIETVLEVVWECQVTAIGAMDCRHLEKHSPVFLRQARHVRLSANQKKSKNLSK